MKVVGGDSYSILPATKVKPYLSQLEDDDEDGISIEEDAEEESPERPAEKKWKDFNEDDPEVQNAKLLEKYAQMQGYNINQDIEGIDEEEDEGVVYVDENGHPIDPEQLKELMDQKGLVEGEDGNFYLQDFQDEDDQEYDEVYKDIVTADDYINDEEEAKANFMEEKRKLKEKILYQRSTSNEGSASGKNKKRTLAYYEEMGEDGNIYLYEKKK